MSNEQKALIEMFKDCQPLLTAIGDETRVNFHIISDWFNHNKTDEKERNNVKIMSC